MMYDVSTNKINTHHLLSRMNRTNMLCKTWIFLTQILLVNGFFIVPRKSIESKFISRRNHSYFASRGGDNALETAQDYRRKGSPNEAVSVLTRFLKEDDLSLSDLVKVHYQIASAYDEMGRVEESVCAFQKVIDLENQLPSNNLTQSSNTLISQANVLLDGLGTRETSYEVFKRADHPGPSSLLAGMTADSLGLHGEARNYYQNALIYQPYNVDAIIGMISNYKRFGCRDEKEMIMNEKLQRHVPSDALSSLNYALTQNITNSEYLHYFTYDMIQLGLRNVAIPDGLVLEFGVYYGKTLKMISSYFEKLNSSQIVHGFDTFDGLPQDWRGTKAGSYSTEGILPNVGRNVRYHVGLFSDCVKRFLSKLRHDEITEDKKEKSAVAFLNIDCDLYSSTMDVLLPLAEEGRIVPGTVIMFDEYIMNPRWQDDEFKAFQEVAHMYGWKYEYIAFSIVTGQAIIKILS